MREYLNRQMLKLIEQRNDAGDFMGCTREAPLGGVIVWKQESGGCLTDPTIMLTSLAERGSISKAIGLIIARRVQLELGEIAMGDCFEDRHRERREKAERDRLTGLRFYENMAGFYYERSE